MNFKNQNSFHKNRTSDQQFPFTIVSSRYSSIDLLVETPIETYNAKFQLTAWRSALNSPELRELTRNRVPIR